MAAKKRAKQPEKQRTRGGASAPAAKSPRRKTAARKKDSPEHRPAEPDTIESATVESSEPEAGDGARQFPVVGIGASAGGLEALRELLEHLPTDTGMAFVFCQHLSPQHKSDLPDILGRSTKMPVLHISDGTRLKPDHLFVLPPNHNLEVMQGTLHLMCFEEEDSHRHLPVDHFFRSLAADMGPSAIGVILSGTGSDGTLGLREIKSAGGLTLVQSTETARYGGMPASAADDVVDFRLSPRQIAEELAHIGNLSRGGRLPIIERPPAEPPDDMQKIFLVLRRATGVDFSLYKQTTVSRRIARRMLLHKLDSLKRYAKYLQQAPGEVSALFEELLINVTGFFRDPETFEALKQVVFPRILKDRDNDYPLRIWVPACSTGEEAYSIAMILLEYLGQQDGRPPIQIFATDVSESAVHKARAARYPENIAADVSPERLKRFFYKTEGGYQISKAIRDMCIVARQNLVRDPPFSGLDLISCRNLLIYMGPQLQRPTASCWKITAPAACSSTSR